MTIFIDLIGSWVVRVAMISAMLGIMLTMNEAVYTTAQYANTKAALENVTEILSTDMNMAGNNVSGGVFYRINLGNVFFLGDLNDSGPVEQVNYYTEYNPRTRLYALYRWVDRENFGRRLLLGKNFREVRFEYYDSEGVRVYSGHERDVVSVRVKLTMEVSGVSSNQGISSVMSDVWIYPANL